MTMSGGVLFDKAKRTSLPGSPLLRELMTIDSTERKIIADKSRQTLSRDSAVVLEIDMHTRSDDLKGADSRDFQALFESLPMFLWRPGAARLTSNAGCAVTMRITPP
jgi:hypothetical protein